MAVGTVNTNNTTAAGTDTNDTISKKSKVNANDNVSDRGTRIVKKGEGMDENAFLMILAAELSNQDPTNAKDGTEYVSQMAQFAGLQQMTNLNTTMKFTGNSSLIGKYVALNKMDSKGYLYSGDVRSVTKKGNNITLSVCVGLTKDKDGNVIDDIREFDSGDLLHVIGTQDGRIDNLNYNTAFLTASSLIGKYVELDEKDEKDVQYKGVIQKVFRDSTGIKLTVVVDSDGKTKDFDFNKVISVRNN